jgi:L,D-transpeptidase catalytic domain
MLRSLAVFLVAALSAVSADAGTLDPNGLIRPELLARAIAEMEAEGAATGKLVVVDYALHSSQERLFVIDLGTGAVSVYRAAHGRGSDTDHDGYLDSFSDVPGSQASPEGLFRLAEAYTGKHGASFRLDGLNPTNARARDRAIVIHAAAYAEPAHLARHGKLGRSNGCIVFSKADLRRFSGEVPEGTLIFVGK